MRKKKRALFILVGMAILVVICALIVGIWHFYPWIESLMQPEKMEHFRIWLNECGIGGAILLFALQVLQVISGIVPALPIQLAAGLSYGAICGAIICLLGVACGSVIVFVAVKKWGRPLVDKMFSGEKQNKLSFLYNTKRLEQIVFIIYFIPAMPKDVFTYLAALTPLSLKRYLSLTIVARTPTILCDTFASAAVMNGNYAGAITVFCITGGLGILCMLFSKRILSFLERKFGGHKGDAD